MYSIRRNCCFIEHCVKSVQIRTRKNFSCCGNILPLKWFNLSPIIPHPARLINTRNNIFQKASVNSLTIFNQHFSKHVFGIFKFCFPSLMFNTKYFELSFSDCLGFASPQGNKRSFYSASKNSLSINKFQCSKITFPRNSIMFSWYHCLLKKESTCRAFGG